MVSDIEYECLFVCARVGEWVINSILPYKTAFKSL